MFVWFAALSFAAHFVSLTFLAFFQALGGICVKVDVLTRLFHDPRWPVAADPLEFLDAEHNVRVLRVPCGPSSFLRKEDLWPHLSEWVEQIDQVYAIEQSTEDRLAAEEQRMSVSMLPNVSTGHYADGGLCAFLMQERLGIPFGTFTIHSPGAHKIDGLYQSGRKNLSKLNFHDRVAAERLCAERARVIVTNSNHERPKQYGHFLYHDAVDTRDIWRFFVIPPGTSNAFQIDARNAGETETQEALEAGLFCLFSLSSPCCLDF